MSAIIYDLNDVPVAVFNGNDIYTYDGHAAAYVEGQVVVGWNGHEICIFKDGVFYDRNEIKVGSITPQKHNPNSPPRRPLCRHSPQTKVPYPPARKSQVANPISDPQSLDQIIRSGAISKLPPPSQQLVPTPPVQL